ncbi:MAG: hypothetical protein IJW51_02525 [Clostridia bacterium]|nr:hypothetical protein [Clostridia bacterium]
MEIFFPKTEIFSYWHIDYFRVNTFIFPKTSQKADAPTATARFFTVKAIQVPQVPRRFFHFSYIRTRAARLQAPRRAPRGAKTPSHAYAASRASMTARHAQPCKFPNIISTFSNFKIRIFANFPKNAKNQGVLRKNTLIFL